ncbi:MAG TPA: heavy metal translocating P-type ATPase [Polyangiaceae bacterium]|nr:heavy metal translocating P-type ATPase [Polyangiaceae bacterium]
MIADSLSIAVHRAPATVLCAHCGQPVPNGEPDAGAQFCCSGCATVYGILRSAGLDDFYRVRDGVGARPEKGKTTGRSYAEFDDPDFARLYCRALTGGRLGTELFLENVHCAACVWLVEKAATVLPGVSEARLDVSRSVVRLAWDPSIVRASKIASWLDAIGYPSHPLQGLDRDAVRRKEDRALLMRIGVAGAAAGNAMLLAIALYCGAFSGIDPRYVALFRTGSVVVALPSILWSANVFYRGALAALRARTPHMDLPISIGIVVGSVSGVVNTFRSNGEVFFDTITMLVFLLLVGRFLQQRSQRRAEGAADHLRALAPSTARLVEGSAVREVPMESVLRDALVEVRAGEHVPVDGQVVEGESSVDTSLLSGESTPEEVRVGSRVVAGSVNMSARLVVRAEKTGHETRLGKLVEAVAEVANRRAPVAILANRLSGYFVAIVLALAAVTLAALWHRGADVAISRAVALLVVTCPCALALATPLTVSAALGRAAKLGLMIKGGQSLEALARPGLVVFDKTGTLTEGKLSVEEFVGDPSVRPLALAVEARSAHVIARAITAALTAEANPTSATLAVRSMRETTGGGIEAEVSGRRVAIGSRAFVTQRATDVDEDISRAASGFADRALTPVLVAVDGRVRGVFGIGDRVRPEARSSLERLAALGYRLAILSGDQPAVVDRVASRIGVRFERVAGGQSPEEKLAFIERCAAEGPVFMVGDGVNDAAALSAATVGIAVHGGAEASLAAADVFATTGGLTPVVELVVGARRTLRVIRNNLGRSLVYNLTVGTLAALGFVGPLLAALLMPVSSIGVITSAYRSRTFAGRS